MRLLSSLILATVGVSAAHATTIDNFTYTYSLGGNTFVNTFSLVDGQGGTYSQLGEAYTVALNGDPASQATVVFSPYAVLRNESGGVPIKFPIFILGTSTFLLDSNPEEMLYDEGFANTTALFRDYLSTNSLSFNPGSFVFDSGGVHVGDEILNFDSSSLTVTQSTTPDPTPVATTPEPGTLCLLGTGLLGACTLGRRRLKGHSGVSS